MGLVIEPLLLFKDSGRGNMNKSTMIPCYVSGKGMHATASTWNFKTSVMAVLESTGLGYDTRYHYYRNQFPAMPADEFARMVCDPIEYYDKDWPAWRTIHHQKFRDEDELVTAFFLERDRDFQQQAQVAIYGFDEAGFGSGVNVMRFITASKPVLGFYNPGVQHERVNIHNVIQLEMEYPKLVTLCRYRHVDEIAERVTAWLKAFRLT